LTTVNAESSTPCCVQIKINRKFSNKRGQQKLSDEEEQHYHIRVLQDNVPLLFE
jgi:hypothetical protein